MHAEWTIGVVVLIIFMAWLIYTSCHSEKSAVGARVRAWLHVPGAAQLEDYERTIWGRYTGTADRDVASPTAADAPDVETADRALAYFERVVDRQVNKVRGVLAFDGILIVAIRTSYPDKQHALELMVMNSGMAFVWISTFICLFLLFVRWPDMSAYAAFRTETVRTIKVLRDRTILIQSAVLFSLISMVLTASAWVVVLV